MGKSFVTLILFTIILHSYLNAYDIVNVNFDEKTLAQLELNTATQVATNTLHNIQVDSIKKKQAELAAIVMVIAAEKALNYQSYRNVDGFKIESKYYKAILTTGADIINHSSQAIEVIGKSKLTGKVKIIMNISGLYTQAVSLGKAFSDIVANCEVRNPLDLSESNSGNKDKYNLLNRHERLRMANDILFRLRIIDWKIRYLTYLCKTADIRDVLFQLDRKTYLNYIWARISINDMINKWNRIEK